jgi:glycosyltransferase involved in cell wall biosynthesis
VQTYIRELLRALPAFVDAELVVTVQADAVGELPPSAVARCRPPSAGVRRAVAGMRSLGSSDLVHGLDIDLPLRPGAPTVSTVHDLSVFDAPWAGSSLRTRGEQLLIRHAMRRADRLIAVSWFTAERVKARFSRECTVIPLAPPTGLGPPGNDDVERVRRRYGLPDTFVLQLGNIEPRKDVHTLADACRSVGVPLVLAGRVGPRVSVPSGATTIGHVPLSDLAGLYGSATVVAYLSWYEGFGLPPLEAMACGRPVVASRVGSIPELLGGAAELVAPGDTQAVAQVLRQLLADHSRRAALGEAGRRRAGQLSWSDTARATAEVYRSLGL